MPWALAVAGVVGACTSAIVNSDDQPQQAAALAAELSRRAYRPMLSNCRNCGAPYEPGPCSYCRTPRPIFGGLL